MRKRNMQFAFGATPTVSMRRSKFDLSHGLKTSMSVGELVPIDVTEVIPGDTFRFNVSDVVRLSSSYLRPVMDNAFMDIYFFFVPNRIVYDKTAEVFGENNDSPYAAQRPLPEFPTFPNYIDITSKSVGDYLGLPVGRIGAGANVLPFRGFAEIYNEWFRNENTVDPVHVQHGDFVASEQPNDNPWGPNNYTGMLPKVGKKKDYFTSCLPSPQKGPPVELSVVDGQQYLPVVARESTIGGSYPFSALHFVNSNSDSLNGLVGLENGYTKIGSGAGSGPQITPDNLWASITPNNVFNPIPINDLRMAFQLQKMLEKDSRYGTRYREYLLGHFGVSNADARMQIPEFLGGARLPLNIQTVASTAAPKTDEEQPLATLGAFSHSVSKRQARFSKSFTEHGFVFTLACIRQLHTYQQGVDRMWFRKKREDYYDPLFANIGEQPVYAQELFGAYPISDSTRPAALGQGDVFGYNEAWADYRYKPSKITGQMRSLAENSLDVYHFGDFYENAPVLNEQFTDETAMFFDRTVAVPSASQDNFVVDFWFDCAAYRVMPVYSVPGLVDHH